MKAPFSLCTIAITGDFGKQRGINKMKDWIQVNGGTFVTEITPKVTHLICSKEHFKKDVTLVKKARKLKTVRIVAFDWLEDSLLKMTRKSERAYMMEPYMASTAAVKKKKKSVRKKNIKKGMEFFKKSCQDFEKEMSSNGYGIYQDSTNFNYDITLARSNLLTNENSRYALKLYTTHATPKYFATTVKYSAPKVEVQYETLAPIGSTWETAWQAFEKCFEAKTGIEWGLRFLKCEVGKEDFTYTPPKEGLPRGVFLEE